MNTDQLIRQIKARQASKKLLAEGPNSVMLAQLVELLQGMHAVTIKGDQGEKGDIGPIGPRGAVGPVGARGVTGVRGVMGPEGSAGPRGLQGLPGPMGRQGPAGLNGRDAEIDLNALEERLYERLRAAIPNTETRLPVIEFFNRGRSDRLHFFDEGTPLGQDIQSVDFVGDAVTATRVGTRVVVTITGGSGVTIPVFVRETPIGVFDDLNTTFTLTTTPILGSVRLFLNGLLLAPGVDYTISGTTITFTAAADSTLSGLPFTAFYRTTDVGGTFVDGETPSGAFDDLNTTFTLASSVTSNSLELYLNGQFLSEGDDYTVSGTTITFLAAADSSFAGLPFLAFYRVSNTGANYAGNETPTGTIDGVNAAFTLLHAPVSQSMRLYQNGLFLSEGTDFTITGSTITFTTAPDSSLAGLPYKGYYRY